jgi:isopenicillin-N N-acyltransferase-like protein
MAHHKCTDHLDRREFIGSLGALGAWSLVPPVARGARRLPFPELRLSGSPGAMGLAHGRAFASQIKHNVSFYIAWISRATRLPPASLLEVARRFAPVLAKHHPALLEEIKGIAKGSGRSVDELLLLNARTEMKTMAVPDARGSKTTPGCTALALTGTKQKSLALGQNWDWHPDLAGAQVILRIEPSEGPRLVTFTEAGMVGKVGFNQHRLGVCLNFLTRTVAHPLDEVGVPLHCLLRAVMGCSSVEEAFKLVAWAPRCGSSSFLLAQHSKKVGIQALALEFTPNATGRIPMRDGFVVHTNHFKDPALAPGCGYAGGRSTTNRNRVATQMARKLAFRTADPVARMKRILASREGAPSAVSKTSSPGSGSMTLAGIVMDLSRNRLHLTAGPPHRSRWIARPGI